jgi:hypothetical protein
MLLIPMKFPDKRDELLVILGPENVERMRRADPVQIELSLQRLRLINPKITICIESPSPELNRLVQTKDLAGLCKFLSRGWEFRPDLGDHDRGPERLEDGN